MTLSILTADLDDPDVIALTTASVAEINARYGGEPGSGPKPRPEEFRPPHGAFLIARLEGRAAGCGGISRLDATTAEVRRMYVAPAARGRRIGRALLEQLLERARDLGYAAVRLETGNQQHEAIGLYRSAGFQPIACWGPFADDPKSLCFELPLAGSRLGG